MNANTLADELDDIDAYEKHQTLLGKASEMLRQQQAEIKALRTALMYAHPAKTLTDFEIKGVLGLDECWVGEDCSIPDMIAFARAILRKAQEK